MAEVLSVQIHSDRQPYFSSMPLRRSQSSQSHYLVSTPPSYSSSRHAKYAVVEREEPIAFSAASSPSSSPIASPADLSEFSSYKSTPTSSLSLDTKFDPQEEISFPSYNNVNSGSVEPPPSPVTETSYAGPPSRTSTRSASPGLDLMLLSGDDTAVREEPTRHVDYLSHDWREEDIWSSWKHIVSNRKLYGERSRLENACWRTWAKSKYRLKTISPETLNW